VNGTGCFRVDGQPLGVVSPRSQQSEADAGQRSAGWREEQSVRLPVIGRFSHFAASGSLRWPFIRVRAGPGSGPIVTVQLERVLACDGQGQRMVDLDR